MTFVRVASLADLWDGDMMPCEAQGQRILLVRLAGTVRAYEDRCAHLAVRLSEGTLDGHVLTCSAHHYQYDARTGQGINPRSICLTTFPVRIEGDEILVDSSRPEQLRSPGRRDLEDQS